MKPDFLSFNPSFITSYVMLGNLLNLSVPEFPHLSVAPTP